MTHPMRPTAEQLTEWLAAALEAHPNGRVALIAGHVAHQAYAAGADDELEASAEWVSQWCIRWPDGTRPEDALRAARRPAPTLQQQALDACFYALAAGRLTPDEAGLIRSALEAKQ